MVVQPIVVLGPVTLPLCWLPHKPCSYQSFTTPSSKDRLLGGGICWDRVAAPGTVKRLPLGDLRRCRTS
eukprot:12938994-Prorocentrum_lima.AAC.1